jgi:hypothetical protein
VKRLALRVSREVGTLARRASSRASRAFRLSSAR